MTSWQSRGGPARTIGAAICRTVEQAQQRDLFEFQGTTNVLAELPAEQVGLVLGTVVRLLLEDRHVDGIDGDDIREVLNRCYLAAVSWLPPATIQIEPLVAVLSSALGIHQPGVTYLEITSAPVEPAAGSAPLWVDPEIYSLGEGVSVRSVVPTTVQYTWHAPLLIAGLLAIDNRPLTGYLDRAFDEISRAEIMDMP